MNKAPILALALSLFCAAGGSADPGPAVPDPGWPGRSLEEAYPFLAARLSWGESYSNEDRIKAQLAGAYCVGNGRLFTMLGLQNPLFTENTIFGPSYQEPSLGHLVPTWRQAGKRLHWSRQSIGWVPDSGMVATQALSDGLAVRAYDYAPPGTQVLGRIWEVENQGSRDAEGVQLELHLIDAWNSTNEVTFADNAFKIHQNTAKRETFWVLGFCGQACQPQGSSLIVDLPKLAPGERWHAAQMLSSAFDEEGAARQYQDASAKPLNLFKQAAAEWKAWNGGAARLSVQAINPQRQPRWAGLGDLLETQKAIFRSEQSHSGSFSPLIGYSLAWVRDNNGPILFWLKLGKAAEVHRVTDFFYAAATQLGFLPPALSVDRSTVPNDHPDFATMGMVHSEVPSWVVLQHIWTYLADGDLEQIRRRYPYLKRCLDAQIISESGRMMLQRDETYLWTLQSRSFPYVPYPNGNFGRYAYTPDSAFEWIAAARSLAQVAELLGKKQDAAAYLKKADWLDARTRELYVEPKEGYYCPVASFDGERDPIPFANVLLNPIWVGSSGPEDQDAKRSVLAGLHFLKGRDNLLKSSPWNGYFVGMNPGQWAVDLARLKHPMLHRVLDGMLRTASPSGDFAEIVDPKGLNWNIPELGQGLNGRLRPWEGGVNADAVLASLSGFEPGWGKGQLRLAPYLPPELKSWKIERLWTRDGPLDVSMERRGEGSWRFHVANKGGADLRLTLDLWTPALKLGRVAADGEAMPGLKARQAWVKGGGEYAALDVPLKQGEEREFDWEGSAPVETAAQDPAADAAAQGPADDAGKDPALLDEPGFGPLPERRFADAPLIYFFSSTMVLKSTGLDPQFYPGEATRRLDWLQSKTLTAAVEMDFSLNGKEFWRALNRGGWRAGPRSVALFDRGAFSQGPHTNKPAQFWNDPDVKAGVREFLQNGGCLVIGGGTEGKGQKEANPAWLTRLAGGSWRLAPGEARCLPAEEGGEMMAKLDALDVIRPGNDDSVREHSVQVAGERWRDQFKLPLWRSNSQVTTTQSGVGFSGWLQFVTKLPEAGRYRVRVWLANHKNSHGMILEEVKDGKSRRLGSVPDRPNLVKGRFFKALDFYLPENIAPGPHIFRLSCPANKSEVHTFSIQVMRAEVKGRNDLAAQLGFPPDHTAGICKFGLAFTGAWKAPLRLIGHPELGGLLITRVGKGLLIRTEMETTDLWPLLKTLLQPEEKEAVVASLKE